MIKDSVPNGGREGIKSDKILVFALPGSKNKWSKNRGKIRKNKPHIDLVAVLRVMNFIF